MVTYSTFSHQSAHIVNKSEPTELLGISFDQIDSYGSNGALFKGLGQNLFPYFYWSG